MTNLIVLTEDAPKVTVGYKDSARAISPNERAFLPKMWAVVRNNWKFGSLTYPFFTS